MESKQPDLCSALSNLPDLVQPQLQHKYLEPSIPATTLSGFNPTHCTNTLKAKQAKNSVLHNEPQKWIAQANKISTQLPNKACKLYLDAAKELAAQHNINMASEALHSLIVTSSAEKLTAKAHLLLARSYFSLVSCNPPPISTNTSSSVSHTTPPPSHSSPAPPSASPSTPSRPHPPLPPRSYLVRDACTWATSIAQEILQKAQHDDVVAVSDDESTRASPTTNDQLRTAIECMMEAGTYSQDALFAALVCDACATCESIGLFQKLGIKEDVKWVVKAAEEYAIAGVQSHCIDALLDARQMETQGDSSFLLKALSKAIIIDDRVRVLQILQLMGSNGTQEAQCLTEIGRAHADADTVALDAVACAWRGVLDSCEDASDALTCAIYHLS